MAFRPPTPRPRGTTSSPPRGDNSFIFYLNQEHAQPSHALSGTAELVPLASILDPPHSRPLPTYFL